MVYEAEINRSNPACFIFLLDQSGSMAEGWNGDQNRKKSDELANIINRLLQNLSIKCAKSDGIRDYFHVGVIGYNNDTANYYIGSAFSNDLSEKNLIPISEIANNPLRIEERKKKIDDGIGGIIEQNIKVPIWIEPVASGGTPMCEAFKYARDIASDWVGEHPMAYPPIIINITDGEANDGDPSRDAEEIKEISSDDGNALLFNVHISSTKSQPVMYPDTEDNLPDPYAQMLFNMSSILPPKMQDSARQHEYIISENSRGYGFNADIISLIEFLDIGTRPSNLR